MDIWPAGRKKLYYLFDFGYCSRIGPSALISLEYLTPGSGSFSISLFTYLKGPLVSKIWRMNEKMATDGIQWVALNRR
jgi:hypothetical protein